MKAFSQNFNSIKVRLEPFVRMKQKPFTLFQFHKGAIRTERTKARIAALGEFQFHKGAIRTR